jgi:hypothetical protein
MKYVATAREILDRGIWQEFCDLRGINEWAINEGRMDASEEFTFTEEEALRLGLTRKECHED